MAGRGPKSARPPVPHAGFLRGRFYPCLAFKLIARLPGLYVPLPRLGIFFRRHLLRLECVGVRRDLDQERNTPPAPGARTETLGHAAGALRLLAPRKIRQLPQRHVVAITDIIVEFHPHRYLMRKRPRCPDHDPPSQGLSIIPPGRNRATPNCRCTPSKRHSGESRNPVPTRSLASSLLEANDGRTTERPCPPSYRNRILPLEPLERVCRDSTNRPDCLDSRPAHLRPRTNPAGFPENAFAQSTAQAHAAPDGFSRIRSYAGRLGSPWSWHGLSWDGPWAPG